MAQVELDKVSPATAAALQVGDSGDTITVPSGVTLTTTDATVSVPTTISVLTEIKTNKISPATGTAFTFGDSGDTFNIPSGATITNSGTASGFGDCVLLSTQTVSSSVTGVEFTTGFSTDYKEYVFKCSGLNTTVEDFVNFQCSTDGGSSYGVTNTSTFFWAYHTGANATLLEYRTAVDRHQSTDFIPVFGNTTAGSSYAASGEIHLFNPSSTTYVKNHYSRGTSFGNTDWAMDTYVAGYFNTTTAINAIKFTYSSGNIQAGTIRMYGYT
jgi:hypothetical protein